MKPPSTVAELRYYARRAGCDYIELKLTHGVRTGDEWATRVVPFARELALLLEQAYLDGVADGKAT